MFRVTFYKDQSGRQPVKEYIEDLNKRSATSKTDRIKLSKIVEYIKVLKSVGTLAGEKYIKHIEGDIWELRPLKDRIFFFYHTPESGFILLHCFQKKTQKTPKREIDQARRNMKNCLEWMQRKDG